MIIYFLSSFVVHVAKKPIDACDNIFNFIRGRSLTHNFIIIIKLTSISSHSLYETIKIFLEMSLLEVDEPREEFLAIRSVLILVLVD